MPSAVKLIDGLSLRHRNAGGYGTVLYRVDDLGFYDYDTAVKDGAVLNLPSLNDLYDPTVETLGISTAQEKEVVKVLSPNVCVVAVRYAPPSGFGSWSREATQSYNAPSTVECPNWSIYETPEMSQYRWSPIRRQRMFSIRVETRLVALSSVSAVQRDLMANQNRLYDFDGLPHLLSGGNTFFDPSGYTRITTKFVCSGEMPELATRTPDIAVAIPKISYNDEWTATPADEAGVPVIKVLKAEDQYAVGNPLFWLT